MCVSSDRVKPGIKASDILLATSTFYIAFGEVKRDVLSLLLSSCLR